MVVWAASIVCSDVGCVTWHTGNMKGTCIVVDSGDVAVISYKVVIVHFFIQNFVVSTLSENKCVCWYLAMSLILMRDMGM